MHSGLCNRDTFPGRLSQLTKEIEKLKRVSQGRPLFTDVRTRSHVCRHCGENPGTARATASSPGQKPASEGGVRCSHPGGDCGCVDALNTPSLCPRSTVKPSADIDTGETCGTKGKAFLLSWRTKPEAEELSPGGQVNHHLLSV